MSKNPKGGKSAAPKAAGKRGRPAKTPEQKAAEKAAKDAAKTEAKKAEGAQRTEAAKAVAGHNSADPKLRELFVRSVETYKKHKKKVHDASGDLRRFFKDALRDGFTKDQFETAVMCEDPEGEAKVQEKIAKALQAAQFVGAMLGKHLDAFSEPDRTPAADRAYSEGQKASMENKAAFPPYAPETEQFRRYMEGFYAHQETLAKFKPLEKAPPSPPPASEVTSGVSMTRSQFNQAQAAPPAPMGATFADDGTGAETDSEEEEFADRAPAS